jgi:probable HAF family extracellular repeat protein
MKSPRKLSRRTLIVFTLLCVAALQPAFGQSFTVKDLGTLPNGFGSVARGINDRGQVVGSSNATGQLNHAALWTPKHGQSDHDDDDEGGQHQD